MKDWLIKQAAREILQAFKIGHVAAATEAYYEYRAFKLAIKAELEGKIPMIFLERILR